MFNTTDGFALDVFVVDGWNNDVSAEQPWQWWPAGPGLGTRTAACRSWLLGASEDDHPAGVQC